MLTSKARIAANDKRHEQGEMTNESRIGEWVEAAQNGDHEACIALIEQFTPCIRSSATRYTHPAVDREDLLQEGYIALLRAIRSFDPARGVYFAWFAAGRIRQAIWTCTRRAKNNRGREQFDRPGDEEGDEPIDGMASFTDPLAEAAFAAVDAAASLSGLTRREQLVVTRCIIGDMRISELARQCEVTPDTAYTWKRRALDKLRRKYAAFTTGSPKQTR